MRHSEDISGIFWLFESSDMVLGFVLKLKLKKNKNYLLVESPNEKKPKLQNFKMTFL